MAYQVIFSLVAMAILEVSPRFTPTQLGDKAQHIGPALELLGAVGENSEGALHEGIDGFCSCNQWIGLRENLQESPIFNGKLYGFRLKFSLKPIHWCNLTSQKLWIFTTKKLKLMMLPAKRNMDLPWKNWIWGYRDKPSLGEEPK